MKSQDEELERDPFLCTCGPCQRFWRNSFHEVSRSLTNPPKCRAKGTSQLAAQTRPIIKRGDRVMVKGKSPGIVRYVGFVDDQLIAPELYVGVKLDDNVKSLHNGIYRGKRYFNCPRGHAAMVKVNDIHPLATPPAKRPVHGNTMFPSYKEVWQRRKEREESLAKVYEESNKPKTFTVHAKPPRISPHFNRTYELRTSSAPHSYQAVDPHDIALQDHEKRQQKMQRKMELLESSLMTSEEQQLRQWERGFGGSQQGQRMAHTLQKLHVAYQKGLDITRSRNYTQESSSEVG